MDITGFAESHLFPNGQRFGLQASLVSGKIFPKAFSDNHKR